ncbi:uncharacterized protein [Rutidosis leptorrhynchoides]|uniref:uncharacterized protein n=1 Tax=Rutidosis leptorrhynchoides TaxID=125765 RepID=UPI003A990341
MEGYVCSKRFPKPYNVSSYFDRKGYTQYQRRITGVTTKKGDIDLDNGYVVPYNSSLCLIFHAHINVEHCGWTMLIKYLFKYISKGTDRIVMRISRPIGQSDSETENRSRKIDEIENFVDGRFICPYEACWRIMLEYNRLYSEGHRLSYLDFPKEFVWGGKDKGWTRKRNLNKPSIGKLSYMHPTTGEVFYLRMLLCHQKGCKTFQDIRTVNGIVYANFRSAYEAFGLLGDDREWTTTLEEASVSATSAQLRSLFVHILVFCEVVNPLRLWNENWQLMADDIPLRATATLHIDNLHINEPELQQYVLCEIKLILSKYARSITDFGLPSLSENVMQQLNNRLLMEEHHPIVKDWTPSKIEDAIQL